MTLGRATARASFALAFLAVRPASRPPAPLTGAAAPARRHGLPAGVAATRGAARRGAGPSPRSWHDHLGLRGARLRRVACMTIGHGHRAAADDERAARADRDLLHGGDAAAAEQLRDHAPRAPARQPAQARGPVAQDAWCARQSEQRPEVPAGDLARAHARHARPRPARRAPRSTTSRAPGRSGAGSRGRERAASGWCRPSCPAGRRPPRARARRSRSSRARSAGGPAGGGCRRAARGPRRGGRARRAAARASGGHAVELDVADGPRRARGAARRRRRCGRAAAATARGSSGTTPPRRAACTRRKTSCSTSSGSWPEPYSSRAACRRRTGRWRSNTAASDSSSPAAKRARRARSSNDGEMVIMEFGAASLVQTWRLPSMCRLFCGSLHSSAMRPGERAARAAAYERARPEILEHVPRTARRVLDLGCATGTTGAALKQRQAVEVVGRRARARVRARGGDPAGPRAQRRRRDRRARAAASTSLIAADILEHLKDPWSDAAALRGSCSSRARPSIVSLPNVGHWSTYAHLARGSWPRKPEGIFDATHLRWFTLRDAHELLAPGRPDAAHRRAPRLALHARLAPGRARPAAAEGPGRADPDHVPARHRRHSLTKVRDMRRRAGQVLQPHGDRADRRAAGLLSGLRPPARRRSRAVGDRRRHGPAGAARRGSTSTRATSAG